MRLALLTLAALAMLVAFAAGVAAVVMPAAIFVQFPLGRYSLIANRSVVELCKGSEIRAWVPLVAIALVMGLPSTIYLWHAGVVPDGQAKGTVAGSTSRLRRRRHFRNPDDRQ